VVIAARKTTDAGDLSFSELEERLKQDTYERLARNNPDISSYAEWSADWEDLKARIGRMESDGRKDAVVLEKDEKGNPVSTAKGIYQFLDASVPTAKQRFTNVAKRLDLDTTRVDDLSDDPREWSGDASDLLLAANTFEYVGSDTYLRGLGGPDSADAQRDIYANVHHTNVDDATLARMDSPLHFGDDPTTQIALAEPSAAEEEAEVEAAEDAATQIASVSPQTSVDEIRRARQNRPDVVQPPQTDMERDLSVDSPSLDKSPLVMASTELDTISPPSNTMPTEYEVEAEEAEIEAEIEAAIAQIEAKEEEPEVEAAEIEAAIAQIEAEEEPEVEAAEIEAAIAQVEAEEPAVAQIEAEEPAEIEAAIAQVEAEEPAIAQIEAEEEPAIAQIAAVEPAALPQKEVVPEGYTKVDPTDIKTAGLSLAIYDVTGPDGQVYEVNGPEDATEAQVIGYVRRQLAKEREEQFFSSFAGPSEEQQEEQEAVAAAEAIEAQEAARIEEEENTNAISAGFSRGVDAAGERFGSFQEGLGNIFDSDYLREAGAERIAANAAQLAEAPEAMGYKDVEGVDSFLEYFGGVLGETAPQTGGSILAAAATGAAVGSVVPGLGTLAGFSVGAIGGALSQVPFFWGGNRERQKEAIERGERVEIDEAAAALTAIPQALLDSIAERFQLLKLIPTKKLLTSGGFFTRAAKGIVGGVTTEVPTEIGQSVLERAQAGLDIGSEEAIDEYIEVGIAAGLVGGTLGGTIAAASPDDRGAGATRAALEARIDELTEGGATSEEAIAQAVDEASTREDRSESELMSILNIDSDIGQEVAEVEAIAEEQEAAVETAEVEAAIAEVEAAEGVVDEAAEVETTEGVVDGAAEVEAAIAEYEAEQARKELAGSKSATQLELEATSEQVQQRLGGTETPAGVPINKGAAERAAAIGQPENEGANERTAEVDARIESEKAPTGLRLFTTPTDKGGVVKPYAVTATGTQTTYFKTQENASLYASRIKGAEVITLADLNESAFTKLVGDKNLKRPESLEQTSGTYNSDVSKRNQTPGEVVQAGPKTRAKVNRARNKAYSKRNAIIKKLNTEVTRLKNAGQTSAEAIDNAIKKVVASKAKGFEDVTSEQILLKQIGTSKEKLIRGDDPVFSRVDAANTATEAVIKGSQEASETLVELGERITGLEEVGSEGGRPAAVDTALKEIAAQKGTTKKEVLASIGTTKEKLVSNPQEVRDRLRNIEGVSEALTADIGKRKRIGKKLTARIAKSTKSRSKVVPEAVKEIAVEEGVTTQEIYDLLGTTDKVLASDPARGTLNLEEEASFNAQITQDVLSKIKELDKFNRFLGVAFDPELDKYLDNDVMVPLWNNDLQGALLAVAKMLPNTPKFAGMVASARKLAKVVGDTKVVVVLKNPTTELEKTYRNILDGRAKEKDRKVGPPLGMYISELRTPEGQIIEELTNVILLEEGMQYEGTVITGLTAATLLHEMSHAATIKFIRGNPKHNSVIEIKKLFEQFKQDAVAAGRTTDDLYAMTSVEEFIAEAYGSAEFQQYLAQNYVREGSSNTPVIGLGNKLLTMWQKFKNALYNMTHHRGAAKTIPAKTTEMSESIRTVIDTLLAPNYNERGVGVLLENQTPEGLTRMLSDMDNVNKGINRRYSSIPTKGTGNSFVNAAAEWAGSVGTAVQKGYFGLTPSLAMADIAGWYDKDLGVYGHELNVAMDNQRAALRNAEVRAKTETSFLNAYLRPITTVLAATTEKSKQRLKEVKLLNTLLGESTIREADLRLTKKQALEKYGFDSEAYGAWKDFHDDYLSLSPEGKKVYADMIDVYAKLFTELLGSMTTSLASLKGVGVKEKKQLEGVYKELIAQRIDPYLPLHRQGKYRLSFDAYSSDTNSTEPVFLMFETRRERELYVKNVLTGDKKVVPGKNGKPKVGLYETSKDAQYQAPPNNKFVDQLLDIIPSGEGNQELKTQIINMFVESLPQSAIAKSFQKRQNIAGYEGQFTNEFGGHIYDLTRKIELMKHKAIISGILDKIKGVEDDKLGRTVRTKAPFSTKGSLNVVPLTSVAEGGGGGIAARDSLESRAKFALNPTQDIFEWSKKANRVAFIWTIGFNASSAIVNLSQIPIFIFANLAGTHGIGETVAALRFAMGTVLNSGMTRLDAGILDRGDARTKSWVLPSIENLYVQDAKGNFTPRKDKKMSTNRRRQLEELAPLVKLAHARGQLSSSAITDYLGINEAGRSVGITDRVTSLSALMFHAVEQFNRQTTLIASYKLELERVKKDNPSMSTQKQREAAATDALLRTQEFNGGAVLETAAPWFQSGIGRVAGMYKGFGLQMYYTMFKSAKVALTKEFPGDSAKQKEARKAAWRQIVGVHATALLFSGVAGVPMFGTIAAMYDTMIKEDEDETFEELTRRHLGVGWYKGGLSNLLGVDASRRMALTNLFLQENRYAYNESTEEQIFGVLGGPSGSVLSNVAKGYQSIMAGKTEQGINQMLPAAVKNMRKAMKIEDDGLVIKNSMGSVVSRNITSGELLGQYIGFSPLKYSLNQENISARKRIDEQLNLNGRNLLSNLNKAKFYGDEDRINEAMAKIVKYNDYIIKKYPKEFIGAPTIGKSYETYLKNRGQAIFGQTLSSRSSTDIVSQMFYDTSQ
jgi:hypothetical protein